MSDFLGTIWQLQTFTNKAYIIRKKMIIDDSFFEVEK